MYNWMLKLYWDGRNAPNLKTEGTRFPLAIYRNSLMVTVLVNILHSTFDTQIVKHALLTLIITQTLRVSHWQLDTLKQWCGGKNISTITSQSYHRHLLLFGTSKHVLIKCPHSYHYQPQQHWLITFSPCEFVCVTMTKCGSGGTTKESVLSTLPGVYMG